MGCRTASGAQLRPSALCRLRGRPRALALRRSPDQWGQKFCRLTSGRAPNASLATPTHILTTLFAGDASCRNTTGQEDQMAVGASSSCMNTSLVLTLGVGYLRWRRLHGLKSVSSTTVRTMVGLESQRDCWRNVSALGHRRRQERSAILCNGDSWIASKRRPSVKRRPQLNIASRTCHAT